jgi:hypothetical protein
VHISVAGRTLTADLNAKSVRKTIATICEAGVENVACILQGKLQADNSIAEAGLSVQLKTKPAEAPAALIQEPDQVAEREKAKGREIV